MFKLSTFFKKKGEDSEELSILLHQLRSPLTSVALAQQTLFKNNTHNLSPEQLHIIEQMGLRVEQMQQFITGMLNSDMLIETAGDVDKRPCDIESLLDSIFEQFSIQLSDKRLHVVKRYDEHAVPVSAVCKRVVIALSNLLDNAIKYTPHGGTISVTTQYTKEVVQVQIIDTGIGVPDTDIASIFKKYTRASTVDGATVGSGLGLYIVQKIAQEHGGAVLYTRNTQQESVFTFTIPV